MNLDEAIKEFGGKAGQLMVLKEAIPDLPIPKFFVIKNDEINGNWNNLLQIVQERIRDLSPPYIVRGSNPDDHFGLEGIIPTYPEDDSEITNAEEVRHCAGLVAGHCSHRAKTEKSLFEQYQELCGPTSNITHGLIMEKNPSRIMLVALRHPHNQDIFHMEFISGSSRQRKYLILQYNTKEDIGYTNELSNLVEVNEVFARSWVSGITKDYNTLFREVVSIIKSIEQSGKITPDYAQHFEFGFDHLGLFQVRPFMPYSEPKFELNLDGIPPERRTKLCFKQTPPEGIEYYYVGSGNDSKIPSAGLGYFNIFTNYNLTNFRAEAECGFLSEAKFQKQWGFAIKDHNASFLSHCIYRFIKRSEVALIGIEEKPEYGEVVRVVSNGIDAGIYASKPVRSSKAAKTSFSLPRSIKSAVVDIPTSYQPSEPVAADLPADVVIFNEGDSLTVLAERVKEAYDRGNDTIRIACEDPNFPFDVVSGGLWRDSPVGTIHMAWAIGEAMNQVAKIPFKGLSVEERGIYLSKPYSSYLVVRTTE